MDVAGDKGKPLRGKGAAHANELMEMLKEAKTPAQRRILAQELAATRAGAADKRARALSKVRVVGTTTASCGNAALEGMNFDVVVLDECSQMTEPSSMLAMSRFGCRALVAVGDPKQLPPVLDSKDLVLPADSKDSNNSPNPLAKGIFVRLREAGHPATLLRTQYPPTPETQRDAQPMLLRRRARRRVRRRGTWRASGGQRSPAEPADVDRLG